MAGTPQQLGSPQDLNLQDGALVGAQWSFDPRAWYKVGDLVTGSNGILYQCIQNVTEQSSFLGMDNPPPEETPSHWMPISINSDIQLATSAPSVRSDGSPLRNGDIYIDTATHLAHYWNGTSFVQSAGGSDIQAATTAPTTRASGAALEDGDMYFNTTDETGFIRVSNAWVQATFPDTDTGSEIQYTTARVTQRKDASGLQTGDMWISNANQAMQIFVGGAEPTDNAAWVTVASNGYLAGDDAPVTDGQNATTRRDGSPVQEGDFYYQINSNTGEVPYWIYSGSAWNRWSHTFTVKDHAGTNQVVFNPLENQGNKEVTISRLNIRDTETTDFYYDPLAGGTNGTHTLQMHGIQFHQDTGGAVNTYHPIHDQAADDNVYVNRLQLTDGTNTRTYNPLTSPHALQTINVQPLTLGDATYHPLASGGTTLHDHTLKFADSQSTPTEVEYDPIGNAAQEDTITFANSTITSSGNSHTINITPSIEDLSDVTNNLNLVDSQGTISAYHPDNSAGTGFGFDVTGVVPALYGNNPLNKEWHVQQPDGSFVTFQVSSVQAITGGFRVTLTPSDYPDRVTDFAVGRKLFIEPSSNPVLGYDLTDETIEPFKLGELTVTIGGVTQGTYDPVDLGNTTIDIPEARLALLENIGDVNHDASFIPSVFETDPSLSGTLSGEAILYNSDGTETDRLDADTVTAADAAFDVGDIFFVRAVDGDNNNVDSDFFTILTADFGTGTGSAGHLSITFENVNPNRSNILPATAAGGTFYIQRAVKFLTFDPDEKQWTGSLTPFESLTNVQEVQGIESGRLIVGSIWYNSDRGQLSVFSETVGDVNHIHRNLNYFGEVADASVVPSTGRIAGDIFYDLSTNTFKYYDSSDTLHELASVDPSGGGGRTTLASLNDTLVTDPAVDEYLVWSNTESGERWVNKAFDNVAISTSNPADGTPIARTLRMASGYDDDGNRTYTDYQLGLRQDIPDNTITDWSMTAGTLRQYSGATQVSFRTRINDIEGFDIQFIDDPDVTGTSPLNIMIAQGSTTITGYTEAYYRAGSSQTTSLATADEVEITFNYNDQVTDSIVITGTVDAADATLGNLKHTFTANNNTFAIGAKSPVTASTSVVPTSINAFDTSVTSATVTVTLTGGTFNITPTNNVTMTAMQAGHTSPPTLVVSDPAYASDGNSVAFTVTGFDVNFPQTQIRYDLDGSSVEITTTGNTTTTNDVTSINIPDTQTTITNPVPVINLASVPNVTEIDIHSIAANATYVVNATVSQVDPDGTYTIAVNDSTAETFENNTHTVNFTEFDGPTSATADGNNTTTVAYTDTRFAPYSTTRSLSLEIFSPYYIFTGLSSLTNIFNNNEDTLGKVSDGLQTINLAATGDGEQTVLAFPRSVTNGTALTGTFVSSGASSPVTLQPQTAQSQNINVTFANSGALSGSIMYDIYILSGANTPAGTLTLTNEIGG